MKRGLVGLLLVSAVLGTEVHGAGGWRYAGWGMTLKQLLAAGKSEAAVVTGKPRAAGGRAVLAEIPDYVVAGTVFRVRFFFLAGRLDSVTLNTRGDPGAAAFDRVEAVLLATYGQPISRERDQIVWTAPRTTITLLRFPESALNVLYTHADSGLSKD